MPALHYDEVYKASKITFEPQSKDETTVRTLWTNDPSCNMGCPGKPSLDGLYMAVMSEQTTCATGILIPLES